jgi:SET domain-containing protein
MLKPSQINDAGVGVFVLHDVAKGTFLDIWTPDEPTRLFDTEEVPPELIRYCVAKQDGKWECPFKFNQLAFAWFLNHSINPNATFIDDKGTFAITDIRAGEEITIDYDVLNEPNNLRENFYQK